MAGPPTVVLADGDVLVRDILRAACADGDLAVVGETACADGLVRLCEELRPAVTISGDCLGRRPVENILASLVDLGTRVVVLSADRSPERFTAILGAGASGYLFYDTNPQEAVQGALAVAQDAVALNAGVAKAILHQWRRLRTAGLVGSRGEPLLTPRETDVLAAMADGLATKAIATRLGVATKTIENHKIRVFEKLAVRTQAQAVGVAISYGLVPPAGPANAGGGAHGAVG